MKSHYDKPYAKGLTLREQNPPLKYCQSLELLTYFEKRFRAFNAADIGFLDQRAAKLLAVKVGVLKKRSAISAVTATG